MEYANVGTLYDLIRTRYSANDKRPAGPHEVTTGKSECNGMVVMVKGERTDTGTEGQKVAECRAETAEGREKMM